MKKIATILTILTIISVQIVNAQHSIAIKDHFKKLTNGSSTKTECNFISQSDNSVTVDSGFEFMGETFEEMPEEMAVNNSFLFMGESFENAPNEIEIVSLPVGSFTFLNDIYPQLPNELN